MSGDKLGGIDYSNLPEWVKVVLDRGGIPASWDLTEIEPFQMDLIYLVGAVKDLEKAGRVKVEIVKGDLSIKVLE
jgi:hypothetical protein